jgi:hypothetical protein
VNDFLRNLRKGEWGDTKWQEPSFSYRGLCLQHFSDSDEFFYDEFFYCPPHPKKKEKRSSDNGAESEEMIEGKVEEQVPRMSRRKGKKQK